MRLPLIIATFLVGASTLYKSFKDTEYNPAKNIISFGAIFVLLGILGNTKLALYTDMFSYIIITIVVLNDGYDMVSALGS